MTKTSKKVIVKGIKVTMDEDLKRKYESIKDYLGVKADAEVIRVLINQYYRDYVEPNLKKKGVKELVV